MKNTIRYVASILVSLLLILNLANAAQLKEARVTQIISDVKLLPQQKAPRPAALNDQVRNGTAVRTGAQSRSELTFTDLTITRLGANTIFSFEEGTRTMDLRDGAVLFQVPKGSGGATIRTTAVTAAITGTTGIGEFHPGTATRPHPFSKWLCLEGTFHLTLPNGQSVEIGPGKMVTTNGESFSPVMTFNISQVMQTSLLVTGFDTPLASLPLIQIEQGNQGGLVTRTPITNTSLLDPSNIIDAVDQGMTAQESPTVTPTPPITPTPSTPTPPPMTPTPTPGKFGTLTTIASPDPYVITSDTEITTDPSITTNGRTDFGKIYRDSTQDGALSAFIFGSTSAFDTASGFDSELAGDMGAAGFKFTSLKLAGDPSISTLGGPANLGLIAVDGITSGGPGGVLNFAGIRGLLLATQDGAIDLGPEISFAGLHNITFYARGSGSMLTLACDVSTTNKIRLYGEGGMELSSDLSTNDLIAFTGGDFDFSGGSIDAETISIISGGDLTFSLGTPLSFNTKTFLLQAEGNIQVNDSLEIIEDSLSSDADLNISLVAGSENILIEGDLSLTSNPGDLITGANIVVTSGGNTVIDGALTLLVDNSNGGHIGTGGNISVTTGGNLTADSVDALVNNREGGSIDSGGNITFDIGGTLATTGDASFVTSNRNDGNGGGTIGSNVVVTLDAASASIGGFLITDISTNGGGTISNGTVNVNVPGNFVATGGAEIDVQNTGFNMIGGPFIGGATINTDAKVNVTAGSISSGDFLDVEIDNNGAGHIGRDAIITTTVSHNVSSQTDMFFDLTNQANGGGVAGFIGRNASINLSAGSISAGGLLDVELINDAGGHIGGNALLNVQASGTIMAQEDTFIEVLNRLQNSDNEGSIVGTIVGNATNNFSAGGNVTIQGLLEIGVLNNDSRVLNGAGHIGGDADIVFSAANVSSTGFLNLVIDNVRGSIDGAGTIDAHASNISTGDSVFAELVNNNGQIGSDASVSLVTAGNINATHDVAFELFNPNGAIGGNATLNGNATNVTAGGTLFAFIDNSGNASIGGNATINMNISGNATSTDTTIQINGSDNAQGAAININGGNYNASGQFFSTIDGNGTLAFNNASVHADVLKAGVFGANGVLNIGGGTLSADSTLKLYATGSNGQINFISNVTLGGLSAKVLAANSITIFNGVVVTVGNIADENPADVYTNHANYSSDFGGNDSTTGTFAGSGANDPQPLPSAPPFNESPRPAVAHPRVNVTSPHTLPRSHVNPPHRSSGDTRIDHTSPPRPRIRIRNSDQLLSLLDRGAATPGGKITVPATNNPTNPGRPDAPGHVNAERAVNISRTSLYPASRSP